MFTERTLNEIRSRLNIVDVISEQIELKKSGQGYSGICPFHKEKTPSFHVHPVKQIFHCFGCQKGGNLFTFVSEFEGLNFPETVQRLAKRAGVTIEETQNRREIRKPIPTAENNRLIATNEMASKYFSYLLWEKSEYGHVRDYLKSRGLDEKTSRKFRLGVSPSGWNNLIQVLSKKGFSLNELISAGLVIPKENQPNSGYDRFRERLMFPITDAEGNVIGFGARQLDDEPNQPKYINSPESPLFSKRRVLYGMFENQRGIRVKGEAIVVEGYMDVIGLHQAGVQNAIATMGTALTEEHCLQLKNLSRRVITVFDPDRAGIDAWHRSVHLFMANGIFAKDLSLPNEKDPDEFVLEHGSDAFYALCEKAPRQITKWLKEIATRGPLSEEQTAKALEELTPILVASRKLTDRALLWDDISLVLKTSVESLRVLAESYGQNRPPAKSDTSHRPQSVQGRMASTHQPKRSSHHAIELDFFQTATRNPRAFLATDRRAWDGGGVREDRLLKWLRDFFEAKTVEGMLQKVSELVQMEQDPELLAGGTRALVKAAEKDEDPDYFNAISQRIVQRKKEFDIKQLTTQLKLTQRAGDEDEQIKLLSKLKELRTNNSPS